MTTQEETHNSSGNTTPSSYRARSFLFTMNNTEQYPRMKELLTSLKSMTYMVSAEEIAPTTGKKHIHIFAHFDNPYRLNNKIRALGSHIDCVKYPMKALKYVKKDGKIIDEIGSEPHQGQSHTVRELAEIDDPSDLDWKEFNTWEKIHKRGKKIKKSEWKKNVEVIYITGPSGIGKSNKAEEICDDEIEEIKHTNDFWTGICDGTGCCIYDDFRDNHMKAAEFINFIDYRVHNMNVKGGNIKNNYTKIIITSIQRPEELYRNVPSEQREQWLRRMTVIDLYKQEASSEDYA